jgi:hypothetical protein
MTDLNKGEIGQPLVVNFGEDISLATAIIELEPEVGLLKEFTATIPATNLTIDGQTLLANEYALYTTLTDEDLDYVGRVRMRAKLTFSSTDARKSNYVKFRVLP